MREAPTIGVRSWTLDGVLESLVTLGQFNRIALFSLTVYLAEIFATRGVEVHVPRGDRKHKLRATTFFRSHANWLILYASMFVSIW